MSRFITLIFVFVIITAFLILCSFLNLSADVSFFKKVSLLNDEVPIALSTIFMSGSLFVYLCIAFFMSKKTTENIKMI